MTPETEQQFAWFEETCADKLAALRAELDQVPAEDRETYLLVRCLRLAYEQATLTAAFARLEDTARDMAKLARMARRQGEGK